jgi:hypothetical protein
MWARVVSALLKRPFLQVDGLGGEHPWRALLHAFSISHAENPNQKHAIKKYSCADTTEKHFAQNIITNPCANLQFAVTRTNMQRAVGFRYGC